MLSCGGRSGFSHNVVRCMFEPRVHSDYCTSVLGNTTATPTPALSTASPQKPGKSWADLCDDDDDEIAEKAITAEHYPPSHPATPRERSVPRETDHLNVSHDNRSHSRQSSDGFHPHNSRNGSPSPRNYDVERENAHERSPSGKAAYTRNRPTVQLSTNQGRGSRPGSAGSRPPGSQSPRQSYTNGYTNYAPQ